MTNDENHVDAELKQIDAQLRDVLRAPQAPEELAERAFEASVGQLGGQRDVAGRIGWWRFAAAAVVLMGVYVAAWMWPSGTSTTTETAVLPEAQVEQMEQAIAGATVTVDERIDALAMEIDEWAATWGAPGNGILSVDETELAEELIQIESEMF